MVSLVWQTCLTSLQPIRINVANAFSAHAFPVWLAKWGVLQRTVGNLAARIFTSFSTSFSIAIDRKALNRVSEYKYLGVVLDASLTWNAHVDYLIGKVRKRLAMLGRFKKYVNMYTANTVYTSFVLPILDHCDTVWSCCGSVNTVKLEKLQRRAARIVMRLRSSEKALNFLGYVTLENRREPCTQSIVVKNYLSNRCPQFFMHYINYNRDILPIRTRSSDKRRLPSVKVRLYEKSLFYHGCVIFIQSF